MEKAYQKMAKRLKAERNKKGLSHAKLSEALQEKYGITISKDSLINYEVSEDTHSKAGSNMAMRVEYLSCFADFYGVSMDYLTGKTDISSPDVNLQAAQIYTGLTERTIENIKHSCTESLFNNEKEFSQLLEFLFENGNFIFMLHELFAFYIASKAQHINSEIYREIFDCCANGRDVERMSIEEVCHCRKSASELYCAKIEDFISTSTVSDRVKACIRVSNDEKEVNTGVDFHDYLFGSDRYHINQYRSLIIGSIVSVLDDFERKYTKAVSLK